MIPKKKNSLDEERTEQQPAQERVADGTGTVPTLTAEQVYTQRITGDFTDEQISSRGFVP